MHNKRRKRRRQATVVKKEEERKKVVSGLMNTCSILRGSTTRNGKLPGQALLIHRRQRVRKSFSLPYMKITIILSNLFRVFFPTVQMRKIMLTLHCRNGGGEGVGQLKAKRSQPSLEQEKGVGEVTEPPSPDLSSLTILLRDPPQSPDPVAAL